MESTAFDLTSSPSVWTFLQRLFAKDFMPHGHCYFWRPEILWLHVVSDLLIMASYYSIPLMLVYFVRKRKDVPFNWMFLCFGAFIFLCGTTHLMDVWTTWSAAYRIEGLVKLLTALVSVATALLLYPLIPKALALPDPAALERLNQQLRAEIARREQTEEALRARAAELEGANEQMERFNRLATGREQRIVGLKGQVNELSLALGKAMPYPRTYEDKPSTQEGAPPQ